MGEQHGQSLCLDQRPPQADGRIYLQLTKANTAYCDHDIVNEPKGQMAEGFNILICFALTRVWVIKQGCPADSFPNISGPFISLVFFFSSFPCHLSTFYHIPQCSPQCSTEESWLTGWLTGVTYSRANRTVCGVSSGALPPTNVSFNSNNNIGRTYCVSKSLAGKASQR